MPIQIDDLKLQLRAYKRGFKNNQVLIDFSWNHPSIDFATILSVIGQTPLPPYLKRKPTAIDKLRYQTVYSKLEGSVAAPTAGLHFTDRVFEKLRKRDISILEATLHVGAGTFQPIKSAKVSQHSMHEEVIVLTPDLVRALANADTPVICVGTTALRTLESLYWLGVKHILGQETEYRLSQWECYSLPQSFSPKLAFEGLLSKMKNEQQQKIYARTSLMIVPGYTFKTTQALITNFHQPGSTLLLLVAAFIGKSWKELYQYAMQNQYRFLSYGDSSLLFH
jgi:S-adenosylmethionine:tRNA ribosyltransferase-isomerase